MMRCLSHPYDVLTCLTGLAEDKLCGSWMKPLVTKLVRSILKKSAAGLKSFDAEKEGFSFSRGWRGI